jgi:hypothetical protein
MKRETAPAKIHKNLTPAKKSSPYRIQMNVVTNNSKIRRIFSINQNGFITPLKKMPTQTVARIVPNCVDPLE